MPKQATKRNIYDITLMEGYNGIRYIAEKYAVEVPTAVTIEVVYSTDTFKPIKKGKDNRVESYEFEINNAFSRGDIVGGFAYLEFADPTKNELIIMSMHDIEKRKPAYASANFWGGKGKEWKDGKQVEVELVRRRERPQRQRLLLVQRADRRIRRQARNRQRDHGREPRPLRQAKTAEKLLPRLRASTGGGTQR